jgi:hypothetical protein
MDEKRNDAGSGHLSRPLLMEEWKRPERMQKRSSCLSRWADLEKFELITPILYVK